MKTIEMELALSYFFSIRKNLIVTNVSWGLGLHECDLISMSKSGYLTEVEIKVSKADLKKDKDKKHGHVSNKIKALYFALPEKVIDKFTLNHIPSRAGLISVAANGFCNIIKSCIINEKAKALDIQQQYKLARLGSMRIWGLKEKVLSKEKIIKKLKQEALNA